MFPKKTSWNFNANKIDIHNVSGGDHRGICDGNIICIDSDGVFDYNGVYDIVVVVYINGSVWHGVYVFEVKTLFF